jgi:hypothetical protein
MFVVRKRKQPSASTSHGGEGGSSFDDEKDKENKADEAKKKKKKKVKARDKEISKKSQEEKEIEKTGPTIIIKERSVIKRLRCLKPLRFILLMIVRRSLGLKKTLCLRKK